MFILNLGEKNSKYNMITELMVIKLFIKLENNISVDTSRLIKYKGVSVNNIFYVQHVFTSVCFVQTNGYTRTYTHINLNIKV